MKFIIFSRMMAADDSYVQAKITESYIWISICNVNEKPIAFSKDPNCKGSIFLAFDDLEGSYYDIEKFMGRPIELITDEQAQQIVELVNNWKDKVDLCLVNCEAGVSRSSGVALGLSMILNGHDDKIRSSMRYHPNMFVRDKIIQHSEILSNENTPDLFKTRWKIMNNKTERSILNPLESKDFSYKDMLNAFVVGRKHYKEVGENKENLDFWDFATWMKQNFNTKEQDE